MKCLTCDKEAVHPWGDHCDDCQALGTFFQYETRLWSMDESHQQFLINLKDWKDKLTDDEKKYILNVYWKS